jgi:Mg-chelatase subunit ChlD
MSSMTTESKQYESCCICLATTRIRDGNEFLVTPGCCGKWFHQSCINEMKKVGKKFCPACRKAFPTNSISSSSAVVSPPLPPGGASSVVAPVVVSPASAATNQRHQQVPAPGRQPRFTATGLFARMFGCGNFSSDLSNPATGCSSSLPESTAGGAAVLLPPPIPEPTLTTNPLEEDLVTIENEVKSKSNTASKKQSLNSSSAPADSSQQPLQITLTPEYTTTSSDEKFPFYVRVNILCDITTAEDATEVRTSGLDVVCLLDNSGSMSGSKLANLKRAMEFVVSTLNEKDRLSVVIFNSYGKALTGLWKMNEERKEKTLSIINEIRADGGTDIYDGMREGWKIFQNRKTKNPSSCMFLLTDGQDPDHLEEKKDLTATMRKEGTSLFVFGFGNDHDSAHLTAIANAGEGSFIYVETSDTVIDAFGGAIGSQQGQMLRDISLTVENMSEGVIIEEMLTGKYHKSLSADKKEGNVTFADLYSGEKRDFLLKLRLPAMIGGTSEASRSDAVVENFPLVSVIAHYKQHGNDEQLTCDLSTCSIRRVPSTVMNRMTPVSRDIEVDVQVQRLDCTSAMQEAMREADAGRFTEAKERIQRCKTALINDSISYRNRNPMIISLVQDLQEMERKIGSKEAYNREGGRAAMEETTSMYCTQRTVYAKSDSAVYMQSTSSAITQGRANRYKIEK